jgi:hypothetical protein
LLAGGVRERGLAAAGDHLAHLGGRPIGQRVRREGPPTAEALARGGTNPLRGRVVGQPQATPHVDAVSAEQPLSLGLERRGEPEPLCARRREQLQLTELMGACVDALDRLRQPLGTRAGTVPQQRLHPDQGGPFL